MKTAAIVLFGLVALASRVDAQPATTFADLSAKAAVAPGEKLQVIDARGEKHTGTLVKLTPDTLVLRIDGENRDIREADVRRIERGGGHAKLYGAMAGAAGGLAVAAWFASAYGANEGGRFCDTCFTLAGTGLTPAGAGIGAAIGALIDRSSRQTVFVGARSASMTMAPLVGRRAIGLSVTTRF